MWGGPCLLAEDLYDNDGVVIDAEDDPPGHALVVDPQFMAARADVGHLPQVGHRDRFADLQSTKEEARLDPSIRREGGRSNLPVQPDRAVCRSISSIWQDMSECDILSRNSLRSLPEGELCRRGGVGSRRRGNQKPSSGDEPGEGFVFTRPRARRGAPFSRLPSWRRPSSGRPLPASPSAPRPSLERGFFRAVPSSRAALPGERGLPCRFPLPPRGPEPPQGAGAGACGGECSTVSSGGAAGTANASQASSWRTCGAPAPDSGRTGCAFPPREGRLASRPFAPRPSSPPPLSPGGRGGVTRLRARAPRRSERPALRGTSPGLRAGNHSRERRSR